jgi:uncharacterized protein YdaU (DUF1376 family)
MAGVKIRRVDLYSDDALTGTTELSDDEMGVYVRVWLLMYATGGPITEEKLRSVCKSHGRRFKNILNRLATLGKVQMIMGEKGPQISCKRVIKEIQRSCERLIKASQNGSKGGRPKDLAKAGGFRQDNPTSLQQPTLKKDSDSPDGESAAIDPIKDLWDRGRVVLGNAKSAGSLIGKLRKQHGDVVVLQAIVAAETELPSDPASFLVGCCNRAKANGHGKRLSPGEKLYLGFAQAAEGDFGTDCEAPQSLLDRR